MMLHLFFFLIAVILAASGQIFLKKGAVGGKHESFIQSIIHPLSFAGYSLMAVSMLFTMAAMTVLPLKFSIAIMPLQYILVVVLSFFFLDERLDPSMILGSLVILAGILVFSL